MAYSAKVVADSVHDRVRLTTLVVTYPRFVHSEFMTHRVFSRNAASSRAIPIEKMIQAVIDDPAMPVYWGSSQAGMQAGPELTGEDLRQAQLEWSRAYSNAIVSARRLSSLKVHKQIANRILEPFSWITVIVTATDWANFFAQRLHPDAQPELRLIAQYMLEAMQASVPQKLEVGQWHLPLIQSDEHDLPVEDLLKIATARCARVSYLTHEGTRAIEKDLELYQRLLDGGANGHCSPFEHCATPFEDSSCVKTELLSNLKSWKQYRKTFGQENVKDTPYAFADETVEDTFDTFAEPIDESHTELSDLTDPK